MMRQKRPFPHHQTQPSKVMRRNEALNAVIQGKAVSYQQPEIGPKQLEKTQAPTKAKSMLKPKQITVTSVPYQEPKIGPKLPKTPQAPKAVAAKSVPKPTQVNTKTVPAKKTAPPPSEPVKVAPAPKTAEKKAKVAPVLPVKGGSRRLSADIKVLSVAQINDQTETEQSMQECKKIEEKNTQVTEKTEEQSMQETKIKKEEKISEGPFELDELMTEALKEELRDIMSKVKPRITLKRAQRVRVRQVWESLPEQPDTAPDVIAAEKIRHEVADHLRTAIGLNVTKRLLNVFNPLFVKIQFSCRPESGCLTTFLKQHNITSFKRIDSAENTFAARVEDIADFDALCYTKGLKCGSADLKMTPCYKFTQCPPKLKLNLTDDIDDGVLSDGSMFEEEEDEINTQAEEEEMTPSVKVEMENKSENKPEKVQSVNKNAPTKAESDPKTVQIDKNNSIKKEKTNKELKNKSESQPHNTIKSQDKSNESINKSIHSDFKVIDESYNDELDDADILAMLSGGVVIDECGSDDQISDNDAAP